MKLNIGRSEEIWTLHASFSGFSLLLQALCLPAEKDIFTYLSGKICRNIGEIIALNGIIFLMKGLWSGFPNHWFVCAMIAWLIVAGFDVWYIEKSNRYRRPWSALRFHIDSFKECEVKDMDSESSPRRQRILYGYTEIPCPSYNLPCPYENSRR